MKHLTMLFVMLLSLPSVLFSQADITVSTGGRLTLSSGTVLSTGGDIINNGTVTANSGSTINLTGTGAQQLSGTTSLVNLTKNGGGTLTLGNNLTVSGTLTLTNGIVAVGNNTLTLTGTLSGGSATSYISTTGTGFLKRNVAATNVLFPVGNGTYNPVTLNNSGTADNFSVRVKNTFDNAPLGTAVVNKQWTINEDVAGGSNVTVTLQWNAADEHASFVRGSNVVMGRFNGTIWTSSSIIPVSGSNPYTLTNSGYTSFSPFAVGNEGTLPVTLSSFTSLVQGRNVQLNWSTVTEQNNSGFEIERKKTESETWTKLGFVNGSGTTNEPRFYKFNDIGLNTGEYSYRMKQVDYNGNYEYHNLTSEIVIGTPTEFAMSQNYPNPFNPSTKIQYQIPESRMVSLKVYDILGKEVASLVNEIKEAGYHIVDFNAVNISAGIYFYKINTGSFQKIMKLVIVK